MPSLSVECLLFFFFSCAAANIYHGTLLRLIRVPVYQCKTVPGCSSIPSSNFFCLSLVSALIECIWYVSGCHASLCMTWLISVAKSTKFLLEYADKRNRNKKDIKITIRQQTMVPNCEMPFPPYALPKYCVILLDWPALTRHWVWPLLDYVVHLTKPWIVHTENVRPQHLGMWITG